MSIITTKASTFYNDIEDLKLYELINNVFKLIGNTFRETFKYFTIWAIILATMFYIGKLEYYQNSLLLISVIVSIFGFIIIYYYPRYLKIPYFELESKKENHHFVKLVDLIAHQIPLILILLKYNHKVKGDSMIVGLVVACLYLIFNNPNKVYGFKCHDCGNNTQQDIYRCYITCFIMNLALIILVITLLCKLLYVLQNNKKLI